MPINPFEALGPTVLVASLAGNLVRRKSLGIRILASSAGAVVTNLPIGPATPATFFLGTVGPVSAATLVLAAGYLYAAITKQNYSASRALSVCLAITGAVFYPLTFGLSDFDPYDLGYRGFTVPLLMSAFVFVGWAARAVDIQCWIALAALLYIAGAYDSNNLWDYLIFPTDPILAAGALAIDLQRGRLKFGGRAKSDCQPNGPLKNTASTNDEGSKNFDQAGPNLDKLGHAPSEE
jgi:hypothetical protein